MSDLRNWLESRLSKSSASPIFIVEVETQEGSALRVRFQEITFLGSCGHGKVCGSSCGKDSCRRSVVSYGYVVYGAAVNVQVGEVLVLEVLG